MKSVLRAAFAASIVVSAPAVAQTAAPGGAHVELRGSFDRAILHAKLSDGVDTYKDSAGKSGFGYGVEAGYDYLDSNMIFGGYVGIEDSTVKECGEVDGGDRLCVKDGRNITVGVRSGYVLSPNTVIYLKGGYSNGRASATYHNYLDSSYDSKGHDNLDGFHVGAGVQVGIGAHAYGKLEYVYTNYSGYKLSDGMDSLKISPDRHQVVAAIGYRF